MKKSIFAFLILILCLAFASCGEEDAGSVSTGGGLTVEGIDGTISIHAVPNDETESWKYCTISQSGLEPQDVALAYYEAAFEDGDLLHYLINTATGTTACIYDLGGSLDVSVYEYVDGEEHDAATIGSGLPLAHYLVDVSTGEVEKIE